MTKEKITTINNAVVVVDDGTREYPVVNKFGKVICTIHFRPADFSIIDRYNAMMLDFDRLVEPLKNLSLNNDGTATFEQDWQVLKQVEDNLKDKINELFDMDEADKIFATRNPFSTVGGRFFCLNVLNALQSVVTAAVEEETKLSNQRMEKYLSDLKPTKSAAEEVTDAGTATDKS